MARSVFQAFITNPDDGGVLDGAQVTVALESGDPLTIYEQQSGGVAKANPFTVGSDGKAVFYAEPGIYRITATQGGITSEFRYYELGTAKQPEQFLQDFGDLSFENVAPLTKGGTGAITAEAARSNLDVYRKRDDVGALSDITSLSSLNPAALVDGQQFSVKDGSVVRIFYWDGSSEGFIEALGPVESPIDTTEGRLLTVGSFGLGGNSLVDGGDIQANPVTRVFYQGSGATNKLGDAEENGTVFSAMGLNSGGSQWGWQLGELNGTGWFGRNVRNDTWENEVEFWTSDRKPLEHLIRTLPGAKVDNIKSGQVVETAGRLSIGDGGGGLLAWRASEPRANHDGVLIYSPTVPWDNDPGVYNSGSAETSPGSTGCWVRLLESRRVDIAYAGAASGGGASFNSAALGAVASAVDSSHIVTGAPGVYAVNQTFTLPSVAAVDLPGVIFDASGQAASGFTRGVVTVTGGTDTALPALSSDVSAGDISVVFASAHGLSVGEDFLIYNPTDFSFSGWRDYYREGEFCTVAAVVNSTTVRIEGNLMADHSSAASDLYKIAFAKPSAIRCGAIAPDDATLTVDAVQLRKVAYCDISGIKGSGSNDTSIGLENCYRLYGTDIDASQGITGPAVTMYGMKISSCQDMNLTGKFSGRRHGCSMTGGGTDYTIPNRKITVDGHFFISGAATPGLSAADWHGNTQYCEYRGYCSGGGVNISGIDNRCDVQIDAGTNNESIVVSAREVLGFNHDININAVCYGSPNIRGSIDIGGNSTAVSADTIRPGVTKISGHLNLPDSTTNAIRCRNSGSTADWTLDVSGLTLQAPNIDRHLRVDALSGADPKVVTPIWRGSATLTTDTATDVVTQAVILPWDIVAASSEMLYQLTGYSRSVSGVKLTYGVNSPTDNGFTAIAQTNDGANFGAVTDLKVSWSAQIYDL